MREEPTDTFKPGSLFSQRLRAAAAADATVSSAGAIRAASQNLAAQTDNKEVSRILKQQPAQQDLNGRPDIKLTDKLKTASPKPQRKDSDDILPSRKVVESDRPPKPKTPTPSIEKKPAKKVRSKSPASPAAAPQKRKTPTTPSGADSSPSPSSSASAAKKTRKTKPFNRLLEGVTVVLSGFQNPLRGQLRDKLQAMGAKYKPDWGPSCTHLM